MGESIIALLALTAMETVLGIDNIVFISLVSSRLPEDQRPQARRIGLLLAMVMRIALLLTLKYVLDTLQYGFLSLEQLGITQSLLGVDDHAWAEFNEISGRDCILFLGGLFLVGKSVHEIHSEIEGHNEHETTSKGATFASVLTQIAVLDIVFSLDSVITAIGMAESIWVMVTSIIIAVIVMVIFANPIGRFVEQHPTIKILALSFMILVGVMLIAEGAGTHVNKNYIYFAMAFALIVEMLNLRLHKKKATLTSS